MLIQQTKPATLTISQTANILGVSTHTAYRAVRETGQLAGVPVIMVGKSYRFATAAVEELIGPLDFG